MIIELPLNGLFHDYRDMIITSRMVVIRFPSNDGRYQGTCIIIKESNDLEMTVSENHDRKL